MPDLRTHLHVPCEMEALRGLGQAARLKGSIMFKTPLWFLFSGHTASLVLARYYAVIVLVRITNFHAMIISSGFLWAGHSTVNYVNFDTYAYSVTHGHGCPAVPVSCLGGTAGITHSLDFCILIIAI
jgi:hypothetical protein